MYNLFIVIISELYPQSASKFSVLEDWETGVDKTSVSDQSSYLDLAF